MTYAIEVRAQAHMSALFTVDRAARQHAGWQSVRYAGRRYQLFGGVRSNYFIDLGNPIKGKVRSVAPLAQVQA